MKLTINHLKGYLGMGLKILDLTTKTSFDLDKFYNQEIPIEFQNKYGKIGLEQVINDNQLLPLLHPLSSLTKYREDLGFVPMVELFKIAIPKDFEHIEYELKFNDGVCEIVIKANSGNIQFAYFDQSFVIYNGGICIGVPNQHALFEKLNEWHIDYQNLIKENLAIEIN